MNIFYARSTNECEYDFINFGMIIGINIVSKYLDGEVKELKYCASAIATLVNGKKQIILQKFGSSSDEALKLCKENLVLLFSGKEIEFMNYNIN